MSESTHQLAAIMFTDIVGYTALMGQSQSKALELIEKNKLIQKPLIEKFNGKWHKDLGDGSLVSFGSAVNAVNCAQEIQSAIKDEPELKLRIGIHLGDVAFKDNDVFGDGVNIASRIESITDPGGIYISESVQKAIRGQSDFLTESLGEFHLKHVDYPVKVFALQGETLPKPSSEYEPDHTSLLDNLRQRNIFRASLTYIIVAVITYQGFMYFIPATNTYFLMGFLIVGLILAVTLAWNYEFTPRGVVRTTSKQAVVNPYSPAQKKPLTGNFVLGALFGIAVVTSIATRNNTPVYEGDFNYDVAVMYIENLTDNEKFADQLVHLIHTNLAQDTSLKLVSRQRIYDAMKEISGESQNPDRGLATEVARNVGVKAMLVGQALQQNEDVIVQLELIDVASSEIISSEKVEGQMNGIFYLADLISSKIMEESRPEMNFDISEITTMNSEAYQAYYNGLEKYWDFKMEQAREKFAQAIQLDSTFALAYLYHAFSMDRYAISDLYTDLRHSMKFIEKAHELSDRLPEREKLLMEASLAIYKNDIQRAENYLYQLIQIDPDYRPAVQLILNMATVHDIKNFGDIGNEFLERNPTYGLERNSLAYAYAFRGEEAKALDIIQKYVDLEPQNFNPYQSAWEVNMILGREEQALQYLDSALIMIPERFSAWYWKARHHQTVGNPSRALEIYRQFEDSINRWNFEIVDPQSHLLLGRFEDAIQKVDKIINKYGTNNEFARFVLTIDLGIVLIAAHKYREAETLFKDLMIKSEQDLADQYNPYIFLSYYYLGIIESRKYNNIILKK